MSAPHVVIIGGGFGGLWAAKALQHAPVRVTLVDRHNHHVFQPLLYQVATAALSPGDIASPIRWILRRQRNTRVLLAEARSIDTAARRVDLDHGESLSYDYLIVAAGSSSSYFGHDDWKANAPSLKTLDDALQIRGRMLLAYEIAEREDNPELRRMLLTFVIVGGGPTGVEMAGAIAEIARQTLSDEFRSIRTEQARVILVEAGPSVLAAFPEPLREAARRSLTKLGVEVRENTTVTKVEEDRVWLGSERIDAGTVMWAAGVTASPLGKSLGVPTDKAGRVLVHADLSIPGHPEVFVVGDLAGLKDAAGQQYPGVAQVAMQQANAAAARDRPYIERSAAQAVQIPEPRQYGDDRAKCCRRRLELAACLRLCGVGAVADDPHLLADRISQPADGAGAMGRRVPDLSAERAADHRRCPRRRSDRDRRQLHRRPSQLTRHQPD